MIKNFIDWTKANKLATILIFGLIIFMFYGKVKPYSMTSYRATGMGAAGYGGDAYNYSESDLIGMPASGKMMADPSIGRYYPPVSPNPDIVDRKVIREAEVSLQVDSVSDAVAEIQAKVGEYKGYVVNVSLNRPEFGENATVSVRVPAESLNQFLDFVRGGAIKVVYENISGADITDQYVDTETRLAQLRQQKARLEEIMRLATKVEDIMMVQPYIDSVQSQIESLVGQNNYSDAASKVSLVTIYLSTDELSLPYTPDLSWRPQAVAKNATRSLLVTMQKIGTGVIWLGVYSVLIVPAIAIIFIVYMVRRRKRS